MNDDILKSVSIGEQAGEAAAQLAMIIGRYWESLPDEMPEETKNELTTMYADILHQNAFGQSISSVLDMLRDLQND